MSNILSRRLLLRGLPMAPAMAKQAVGEIVKQAVAGASAAAYGMDASAPMAGGSLASGGGWQTARKWIMDQVRAGKVPEHKQREYRRHARYRARLMEDADIEALGSVSTTHKRRMHIESAYRAGIKQDIEDEEISSVWDALYKRFEGQP